MDGRRNGVKALRHYGVGISRRDAELSQSRRAVPRSLDAMASGDARRRGIEVAALEHINDHVICAGDEHAGEEEIDA